MERSIEAKRSRERGRIKRCTEDGEGLRDVQKISMRAVVIDSLVGAKETSRGCLPGF